MSDRRPSLIDQMAMVAASQMLFEEGFIGSDSSLDDDDVDIDMEAPPVNNTMQLPGAMLDVDDVEDDGGDVVDGDDEEAIGIAFTDLRGGDDDDDGGGDAAGHSRGGMSSSGGGGDDGSGYSHGGSEDMDEFVDGPMPFDYQWNPRSSRSSIALEESVVSNFNMSSASEKWESGEIVPPDEIIQTGARRPSFKPIRRSSHASQSEGSFHSAPARAGRDPTSLVSHDYGPAEGGGGAGSAAGSGGGPGPAGTAAGRTERRRPLSISVPNAEGAAYSRRNSHTKRRPSVKIQSFSTENASPNGGGGGVCGGGDDDSQAASQPSTVGPGLLGFKRRSTRRQNLSIQVRSGAMGTLDNAIESLRKQDSNSEWENVAAAVTVVAAGQKGASNANKQHLKFAVNDTVLVFLTLLNVTNMEDPKDTFTVAPVNRFGYPAGEGRIDAEKTGPYTFVLATVKHVHFDEDDRYYTVVRADTGTEQRADSGWMEPLNDPEGIEAATLAAKRTVRSSHDKPIEEEEDAGYLQEVFDVIVDMLAWPADFFRTTMLPWYRTQRVNAKKTVTNLLYGDSPFACKIRVTGINILVTCSFIFLFLEVVNLGFLAGNYDTQIAIVGTVVWSILVLELLFEVLIRPKQYGQLIESDRAFAPSTARHINKFHLIFESLALLTFVPELLCLGEGVKCTRDSTFSKITASMNAVLGHSHAKAAIGRFLLGVTALRFFSVVRHWKQMWINNTFSDVDRKGIEKWLIRQENYTNQSVRILAPRLKGRRRRGDDDSLILDRNDDGLPKLASSEEDQRLKNAATIGTALMVVNSQRALILLTAIVLVLPLLDSFTQQNLVSVQLAKLLQSNNIAAQDNCDYLENAINSWLKMAAKPQPASLVSSAEDTFVLWAKLTPKRCDFQNDDGVITYEYCETEEGVGLRTSCKETCSVWDNMIPEEILENNIFISDYNDNVLSYGGLSGELEEYFAEELNIRVGGITREYIRGADDGHDGYDVTVLYNQNPSVHLVNMGLFFLLLGILILGLYGLQALRGDAIRLVLDPLQRMLKIILRYAENPLHQGAAKGGGSRSSKNKNDEETTDNDGEGIGNFETEQLINAITKIADLLRKCWGVAGAGIISSNLARTKDGKTVVFNPTVPGKRVYALFGFVAINGFSEQLRALDRDVMILINDVAKVVHDEVYRWALGDHGQCNKNLGAAFLMVFRIGDFSEVHKKQQVATDKIFRDYAKPSNRKGSTLRQRARARSSSVRAPYGRKGGRHQDQDGQLQLASLPGIQTFTDRALLGMLKSFAGIHRDKNLNVWKNDFRLSAGVSAYHVDIIYGMDAGWAVEGAVGSEYKIDATYLSPHVNMASRMMSATKQYGVTILVSKAVEELLSRTCRKKLRHLDTVYVKGSKVKQDIFTYDARHKGVDFFLIERTPEQADVDAESYTPNVWNDDQDLRAMRQHVSENFMELYQLALRQYLGGNWKDAYKNFEKADNVMIETVLDDGFLEYDLDELEGRIFNKNDQTEDIVRIRQDLGDGACRVLMSYMERRQLQPPDDWDAVRSLEKK